MTGGGRVRLLLPLLLFWVGAGACRGGADPGDPGISVQVATSPTPAIAGPTRISILVEDRGERVEGARVLVEGTMTHAGMVPVFDSAREEGGRYVVPAFAFTMPGEWILITRVTLGDGREARREHRVRVSDPGPDGGDP